MLASFLAPWFWDKAMTNHWIRSIVLFTHHPRHTGLKLYGHFCSPINITQTILKKSSFYRSILIFDLHRNNFQVIKMKQIDLWGRMRAIWLWNIFTCERIIGPPWEAYKLSSFSMSTNLVTKFSMWYCKPLTKWAWC